MSKKIVVMGGGTGTFPVVSGLKHCSDCEIDSVIAVSDSGGSTGKIRDEFGFQPVGDLRQALAALAESSNEEWIRKILLYRFDKGTGLQGHNLGNLILTALQDMTGDTTQSLEIAEKIFRLEGRVIPVTKDNVNLEIKYTNGEVKVGEHVLDEKQEEKLKIMQVRLVPHATINPAAKDAIEAADMVIIGPGDYYASLMATLIPDGIKETFHKSSAKIVYVLNLMTRFTQTLDMSAKDHVAGIEAAIGKPIDVIVINTSEIPQAILDVYAEEKEYPVEDDLANDPRVVRGEILSEKLAAVVAYDTAHRSLLRHDATKIGELLMKLM
ncbi:hypothetical protein BH10PAT2_BH10PAT2_0800 [soil metagenome]